MEKVNACEQKTLIIELTQGREMANQLKNQLDPVTSRETCEGLVEKILSTYDKALAMLTWRALKGETLSGNAMVESPQSHSPVSNSQISEGSDGVSKDQQCRNVVSKKRKTPPNCSERIRVPSGTGLEGPLGDGHSWRKYGQKDILGANFPRAYFRCSHRNTRGCLATKQVQRSDDDPSIFEVTYKGRHSCIQAANSSSMIFSDAKEVSKPKKAKLQGEEEDKQRRAQAQQKLLNLGQGLKVETEVSNTKEEIFPSFSFPLAGIESENVENQLFSEIMKDSEMMGCYSPAILSSTTSESNYFSSPCEMNNYGMANILQSSESDLTDIISTPTSITNSPFGDLDFSVDQVDFDPSFLLDTLIYFS